MGISIRPPQSCAGYRVGERSCGKDAESAMTKLDAQFHTRTMRPQEIELAVDWAALEGWNPGHADAACFATVDPQGFLLGEIDGAPAATISIINYDPGFSFLGFYIVRPNLRGR